MWRSATDSWGTLAAFTPVNHTCPLFPLSLLFLQHPEDTFAAKYSRHVKRHLCRCIEMSRNVKLASILLYESLFPCNGEAPIPFTLSKYQACSKYQCIGNPQCGCPYAPSSVVTASSQMVIRQECGAPRVLCTAIKKADEVHFNGDVIWFPRWLVASLCAGLMLKVPSFSGTVARSRS